MKRQDMINKLMLLSHKDMFRILNDIYTYNTFDYNFDMFLDSTPVYSIEFKNPINQEQESWLEPLSLRHAIPDFMIDNFTTFRHEDTKITTQFLKIFLPRIFSLNLFFTIKKKQNLYLNPIKTYQYSLNTITNRKNLEYFFKHFFRRKVQVHENIPQRCQNFNRFVLGNSFIYSNEIENKQVIGEFVFTSLQKYNVLLDLSFDELETLEKCVFILNKTKIIILKSTETPKVFKRYSFLLSFIGTTLIGVQAVF